MDKTSIYNVSDLREELILIELKEVVAALKEKGYNSTNQLVGYLLSGDESYITSYNNARKKISKYKKNEILVAFLNDYLKDI